MGYNKEKEIKLIVVEPTKKEARHYKKKHCHINMHSLNYVSRATISVNPTYLDALRTDDQEALEDMRAQLRQRGLKGTFMLRRSIGGLGKKRRGESKEQWLARRLACGTETIVRELEV